MPSGAHKAGSAGTDQAAALQIGWDMVAALRHHRHRAHKILQLELLLAAAEVSLAQMRTALDSFPGPRL
jgi:hypothetical protein